MTTINNSDNVSDLVCKVCDLGNNDAQMLLCDSCETGYHTYCIGLDAVPDVEEWTCPKCIALGKMKVVVQPAAAAPITVVAYRRVSSQGQNDPERGRVGLETQNHTILNHALESNHCITQTYTDIGSGRSAKTRKQFNAMLNALQPNTRILVYSVSRFGRNVNDITEALKIVHSKKSHVYSITEQCTSTDPKFATCAQRAQEESDALSRIVRQSLERRRQIGAHIGPAPFGKEVYRDENGVRRLRDNVNEMRTIDEIKELRKHYSHFSDVADTLNDRGVDYRNGRAWSGAIVSRIVSAN